MHIDRLARVLPLAALLVLLVAPPVSADHCGAAATVSPASGPAGTTFVFRTNLGAASDLRLYRDDRLVKEVFLEGDGFVRYDIETGPGDAGHWRARAEVRTQTDCSAEASFTVLEIPDTATDRDPLAPAILASVVGAALAGLGICHWRSVGRSR
jgi:hypothetical protein